MLALSDEGEEGADAGDEGRPDIGGGKNQRCRRHSRGCRFLKFLERVTFDGSNGNVVLGWRGF